MKHSQGHHSSSAQAQKKLLCATGQVACMTKSGQTPQISSLSAPPASQWLPANSSLVSFARIFFCGSPRSAPKLYPPVFECRWQLEVCEYICWLHPV